MGTYVSVEADLHKSCVEVAVGAGEQHRAVSLVERARVMGHIVAKGIQLVIVEVLARHWCVLPLFVFLFLFGRKSRGAEGICAFDRATWRAESTNGTHA